jgi:hypothetical protein
MLWNLALRELIGTRRLVIVGISVAPSDFELRWLLRQAIQLRQGRPLGAHIVNPNAMHRDKLRGLLSTEGVECYEHETLHDILAQYMA